MLDPKAKIPDSMLISRILHTLTHDEFFRSNNTWDAIPAKEQTIGRLTELLRLLEVRIEQSSNDDGNLQNYHHHQENPPAALKTSASNKRFPDKTAYQPSGNKRFPVPDKTAYQQSKKCFVYGSPDHFIKDCTDPRRRTRVEEFKKKY